MSRARVTELLEQVRTSGGNDPDLHADLLAARLGAASELAEEPAADGPWPPVHPNPFPGLKGAPPEVTAEEVSGDLIGAALEHHGMLIVKGAVGPELTARFRAGVEQAFAEREEYKANPEVEGAEWFRRFDTDGLGQMYLAKPHAMRLVDSPRAAQEFLAHMWDCGLLGHIESHLGARPVFTADKSVLRRVEPAVLGYVPYHQDGAFMGTDIRTVNIWFALTDCGEHAPTLDVVPGRVDRVLPTNGQLVQHSIENSEIPELTGMEPVRLEFEAGDVMLFDHLMVHRTGADETMTETRMAIESWFFAASHHPEKYLSLMA